MRYEIARNRVRIAGYGTINHDEVGELIERFDNYLDDVNRLSYRRFRGYNITMEEATFSIGCVTFTLDEYNLFKEDWEMHTFLKVEETYELGQWFRHKGGEIYVLATVGAEGQAALIGINTGNRWNEPRIPSSMFNIKLSEVVTDPSVFTAISQEK